MQEDDILINSVSMASLEGVQGYERAAAAAFPPTVSRDGGVPAAARV